MEQVEMTDVLSNLRQYLESHSIDTNRLFHCLNPLHRDSNASMKYFEDDRVYCFGCGANYNLVDVIGVMENLDNKEAFKKTLQYYGKNFSQQRPTKIITNQDEKNYEKAFNIWHHNLKDSKEARNYLASRGLSEEVIKRFKLGFNVFDFGKFKFNAIIIPVNAHCFTARNITNNKGEMRYYKPKGCQVGLFNCNALINEKPYCVITEGEIDCLSFETIGINSMGLSSANNVYKFINKEKQSDKVYILALDNDEAGQIAKNSLIEYFDKNNINYCTFDNCGYKDANQALIENKKRFEEEIKKVIETLEKSKGISEKKQKRSEAEM